ncbi:hypothetical protein ABE61_03945 [Lysinibacillus sphaericus]|uniref:hypothetical protein n=1 Tax=Lysinibacillus sphaericus TaxID=1421 RepID=UPI0018CF2D30|nr:hypothetical protein [Lysinibacillus sphaericus]MBG9453248.1 hypothetical protein [Lysinibacillus sphaericus]MBG9476102.1 hypothetical protein [Lysinibacillus sphaericus]MBG9591951.1 hypothetical protein [Lysinibacillus sphaericus]
MKKTVTFAVDTKYKDRIQETFTIEELGIDENMGSEELKKKIENIFKTWVSSRLDISYSIVIDMDMDCEWTSYF